MQCDPQKDGNESAGVLGLEDGCIADSIPDYAVVTSRGAIRATRDSKHMMAVSTRR